MRSVRLPTPLSEFSDLKRRVFDLERRLRGLSGNTRPSPASPTIGFRAKRSTPQSLLANTLTTIIFPDVVNNQDNAYNSTTGVWAVPVTSWYHLYTQISTSSMADGERLVMVFASSEHGDLYLFDTYQGAAAGTIIYTGNIPILLAAGGTVSVKVARGVAGDVISGSAFSAVRLP